MTVSHLTDSFPGQAAAALNALTGGTFSALDISTEEILARLRNAMTGESVSHLTTAADVNWSAILTQADSDGIVFDTSSMSVEEIMAQIANGMIT